MSPLKQLRMSSIAKKKILKIQVGVHAECQLATNFSKITLSMEVERDTSILVSGTEFKRF